MSIDRYCKAILCNRYRQVHRNRCHVFPKSCGKCLWCYARSGVMEKRADVYLYFMVSNSDKVHFLGCFITGQMCNLWSDSRISFMCSFLTSGENIWRHHLNVHFDSFLKPRFAAIMETQFLSVQTIKFLCQFSLNFRLKVNQKLSS